MVQRKLKLNQVLAIEKGVKTRVERDLTDLHRKAQKKELYDGLYRSYEPIIEEADQLPPESKVVQVRAPEVFDQLRRLLTEMYDVVATKDITNTQTKAHVQVGDAVIFKDVPVSFLLYMEKQLNDLEKFVREMPTLSPGERWSWNEEQNCFSSESSFTYKMEKTPTVIVKYEATEHHPAQTEINHVDRNVGKWTKTQYSGAMKAERKQQILDRVVALKKAVKFAREEANQTDTEMANVGEKLFDYLLAP